uniref:Uncharacterized protein n=1 Tax=viral metagenome TaxID=1070528 RepID=A0A6C0CAE6_9ZZZZ
MRHIVHMYHRTHNNFIIFIVIIYYLQYVCNIFTLSMIHSPNYDIYQRLPIFDQILRTPKIENMILNFIITILAHNCCHQTERN